MEPKPLTLIRPTDLTAIPAELTTRAQWVTWQWQWDSERQKWTKRPLIAGSARWASSTNPTTWRAFALAAPAWDRRGHDGIGFVVTLDDPFIGVDLDHCRDLTTGALTEWARAVITTLDTYTELTPSGTGVRLWLAGRLPDTGRKHGDMEIYDRGRYLTVTGQRVPGTSPAIAERPSVLAAWMAATFPARAPVSSAPGGPSLYSDPEILDQARNAANGAKFRALYDRGDTAGYHSGSEAHAALCALLAWYTQDRAQLARLVNGSALAAHRKWATRPDYRDRTIAGALGLVPPRAAAPPRSRQLPEVPR
jgi:primase-polymerase (primpol)-like protein